MGIKMDVSNFQLDYSTLMNTGDSNLNYLSDYNSIKNGSYGKLVNAYYDKQESEAASSSGSGSKVTYSSYKPSPVGLTDSEETLTSVGSAVNALKSSASKLNGSGSVFEMEETTTTDSLGEETTTSAYNTDEIYQAVSTFVNDYNKMLDASNDSVSANIISRVNDLNAMTQDNKDMLSKAGISVGADGRLTLDEKALKAADIEDVKETFNGTGSFADQVSSKTFLIDLAVTREARNSEISLNYQNNTTGTSESSTSTSTSKDTNKQLAEIEEDAENLKRFMDDMIQYGSKSIFTKDFISKTDENGVETNELDYDKDKIYESVSDFVSYYNSLMESGAGSNSATLLNKIGSLNSVTGSNKDALSEIGISIGKDGKLSLSKDTFMNADMTTAENLFKGTGSYGYKVSSAASGIDSAAASEAAKSNTYNNNGGYTNNYNTGDIFNGFL